MSHAGQHAAYREKPRGKKSRSACASQRGNRHDPDQVESDKEGERHRVQSQQRWKPDVETRCPLLGEVSGLDRGGEAESRVV
jgi:hypothetical protein